MDPTRQAPPLKGRQLHFVDVDNLTGGATENLRSHIALRQFYDGYTNRQECDLVFVACCHYSGFAVATAWQGVKIYWRSGKNGADEALLQAFEEANLDGVTRVWVASGDGIFIPVLEALRAGTHGDGRIESAVIALDRSVVHQTIPTVAGSVFTLADSRPISPFDRAG